MNRNIKVFESKMETGNRSNGTDGKCPTTGGKSPTKGRCPRFGIWLFAVILAATGCNKNKNSDSPQSTDERIEQAYREIKTSADAVLLSDDPIGGFEAAAEEYRKMKGVKAVEINGDGMTVEFENGVVSFWSNLLYSDMDSDNIPTIDGIFARNANPKSGLTTRATGKKMCWIIQISEDDVWKELKGNYETLATTFDSAGWKIDWKLGDQVTLDFFMTKLSQYDALMILTHGGIYNDITYLAMGDQYDKVMTSDLDKMESRAIFHCPVTKNGKKTVVIYKSAISTAIRERYKNNRFDNTFVYVSSCHGLQTTSLANAFTSNGAAAFVGWTEANCKGFGSGYYVLLWQGNGYSVKETMDQLTSNGTWSDKGSPKNDHAGGHPDADLTFHPASAANFRMVEKDVMPSSGFETVSFLKFTDGTISLERVREAKHTYTNADGVKFHKTGLAVGISRNGEKSLHAIGTTNEPYTAPSYPPKFMNPCMSIDLEREIITVFSNSKPDDESYSMTGYAYRKEKGKAWTTETVFTYANDGWYSFFGGSNGGNPSIHHFSSAGYYAKTATRDASGNWTNSYVDCISPDLAGRQYYSHKNILVASSAGTEEWSFTDSPTYDDLKGFNNDAGTLSAGAVKIAEILK